ncbi:MAG: alpha/beta fold hydrolase [Acidimicrobiales bacterium]
MGSGPSVVLLHGAGQSSGIFSKLARKLNGEFTVYVPDRRGRGMSGPCREDHGLSV